MLKHFYLGRRAYFPFIFLVAVVLIFGAGYGQFRGSDSAEFWKSKTAFELMVTAVGAVAAFVYFLYDQHHKDTLMFVSLFEKFNTRYDGLNEKLNAIISRPIDSPLVAENITTLYDYFNLCAEEYLYYEAGYIDEKVWQAWLRGMSYFAANESVHPACGKRRLSPGRITVSSCASRVPRVHPNVLAAAQCDQPSPMKCS